MAWSPQLDYRTEGGRARGARSFQFFWNMARKRENGRLRHGMARTLTTRHVDETADPHTDRTRHVDDTARSRHDTWTTRPTRTPERHGKCKTRHGSLLSIPTPHVWQAHRKAPSTYDAPPLRSGAHGWNAQREPCCVFHGPCRSGVRVGRVAHVSCPVRVRVSHFVHVSCCANPCHAVSQMYVSCFPYHVGTILNGR